MIQDQKVETFFPARTELINRTVEKKMIGEALHSGKSTVLLFTADGGTGKTRLLEEVFDQRGSLAQIGISATDLIDLYHPEFHNPDNVQYHIAMLVDPQNRFFQLYHEARQKFLDAEEKGVQRKALVELAEKRDAQFMEDYKALTEIKKVRPLLLFDTTEQIQREHDPVQTPVSGPVENLAIQSWLTDKAPLLPNSIILMAGRSRPDFEKQVEANFKRYGWVFEQKSLEVFELPDALLYIDALSHGHPALLALSVDDKKWIHGLTEGKPILLALALQYIHYQGIGPLRAQIENGGVRDKILIEHLMNLPGEYGGAMHYMLLARNGMDPQLLAHLTGWDEGEIQRFFKDMNKNVLFKSRSDRLFLHDELFELHDAYFRDDARTALGYATIAEYYRELLKQPLAYKDILELRIRSLFYEMQQHPERGYQLFSAWDEEVIWLHIKSTDLRMQDDLLRFANRYLREGKEFYDQRLAEQLPVEIIDSDNIIRRIERATAEEKYAVVMDLVKSAQTSTDLVTARRMAEDPVFKARVLYGLGEAAVNLGHREQAEQVLDGVIKMLEAYNPTGLEVFWKQRALGRTYNRFGYYWRIHGYYAKAMPLYRKAVTEFRQAGLPYLLAQTLTNLAYILSQTGDTETALEHARDARQIWDRYGMSYRKALTLNTIGLILVEQNRPMSAARAIAQAQKINEQFDEPRAAIMLLIAEARALRKQGNLWKDGLELYPLEEADKHLQQCENTLLRAEDMLGKRGQTGALLRWEINNELGSLYCDWAWLHRKCGTRILASTCYSKSIKYQELAREIASTNDMPFQLADSLDDLAQVHGDRVFFLLEEKRGDEARATLAKAEQALKDAEARVPDEYREVGGTATGGLRPPHEHEEGAPYWLVLGKANIWRGVWKFRMLESENRLSVQASPREMEEATQYLLTGQAYFKRYGENSLMIDRCMRYLSRFMHDANVTIAWMDAQITKAEESNHTKLPLIRMRMQNKLGL